MSVKRFISRGGTEYDPESGQIRQYFWGKSTDEKPKTGVNAYDAFVEIDTFNIFCWDPEAKDWIAPG